MVVPGCWPGPVWRPSCFHSEGHPGIKSTGFYWPQTADHIPVLSCVLQTYHRHATVAGFFPFHFFPILLYSPALPYSLPSFLPSCIHLTDMGHWLHAWYCSRSLRLNGEQNRWIPCFYKPYILVEETEWRKKKDNTVFHVERSTTKKKW